MVLKGLYPNFKPFITVITQKKKTLTFSEFKVCLKRYEETESMPYPPNESNNILQMKTIFKKINQMNKPSRYGNTLTNDNYKNYQIPRLIEKTIKVTAPREDNFITFVRRKDTKHFNLNTEYFCQNIRTHSKGKICFFTIQYWVCKLIWFIMWL